MMTPDDDATGAEEEELLHRATPAGAQCRVCFDGREAGVLFKPCLSGPFRGA
jgi:hypothetical protein